MRYFLKGSWQEERQEVTRKQYIEARDGVGSHTRAGHNFASLSVGASFISGVVSGWIEDNKPSMNFIVDWALPEQLDPPTEEEIISVLARINESAKKTRAFNKYVSGPMYKWLKDNLENARIVLLDDKVHTDSLNTHWIVVGINEEAAEKYASRI